MKQYLNIYKEQSPIGTCYFFKDVRPSEESFTDMLRCTFFPYFVPNTFSFFWLILTGFVFVYALYWKQDPPESYEEFLAVSQFSLFQLGENYPYYIVKQYHYYRIFTSLILVSNFYHFLLVAFGIATLSSYVEQLVGFKRMFFIVIISGVGGGLARNLLVHRASVESMTPLCGIIGYLFALYSHNTTWEYLRVERYQMVAILLIMLGLYLQVGITHVSVSAVSMGFGLAYGVVLFYFDQTHYHWKYQVLAGVLVISSIALLVIGQLFWSNPSVVERN